MHPRTHVTRPSWGSSAGTNGKRDAWASRYTSGVSEFGDDRGRTLSLEDDRATIRARQQAVQATNLGLRLGLASSISRDLHSSLSSRSGWLGSMSADSLPNSVRGNDFDPDLSAADISASSARGGNIGFTFPSTLSYDHSGSTMQGDSAPSQGDAIPDPDTSQLSRVVGSVIEPPEKRARWHCSGCGLIFPRDSTIYAPPTSMPTAAISGSVRAPGSGSDPLDAEPTSYFCRPCYAKRFSLGLCAECGGDILGTTRHDGAFIRAPSTGAMYHERCYACVHCGLAAALPPMGDGATIVIGMHGLPLCEGCFDKSPQAPRQERSAWKNCSNNTDSGQDADSTTSPSRKDARAKAVDELRERLNRSKRPAPSRSVAKMPPSVSTGDLSRLPEEQTTPRPRSESFPALPRTEPSHHGMQLAPRPVSMRPKALSRSPRVRDVAAVFETRTPKPESRRDFASNLPTSPSVPESPWTHTLAEPQTPAYKQASNHSPSASPGSALGQRTLSSTRIRPGGSFSSPICSSPGRDSPSSPQAPSSIRPSPNGRCSRPVSPLKSNMSGLEDLPEVSPVLSSPPSFMQGCRSSREQGRPDDQPVTTGPEEAMLPDAQRPSSHPFVELKSHPTSICARCGEPPFSGPQQGAEESAMVTVPGGLELHVECFTCSVCSLPIDGTKPFVRASDCAEQEGEDPVRFAHPKCAPRVVPIHRQVDVPRPAPTIEPVGPRDHATFQRTPKPAPMTSPRVPSPVTGRKYEGVPQSSVSSGSSTNVSSGRREWALGTSRWEPPKAVHQFRPSAGAAPLTRSALFGTRSGTGSNGSLPAQGREPKHNPAAGFFARTSGPALSPSGKGNLTSFTPRTGAYGGMTPCPLCQRMLTSIEGVPGPRGTRWHKACLVCRGTLPSGKPCGKSLDSCAKVDSEGRVLCRECFDSAARAIRLQIPPARATPTRL